VHSSAAVRNVKGLRLDTPRWASTMSACAAGYELHRPRYPTLGATLPVYSSGSCCAHTNAAAQTSGHMFLLSALAFVSPSRTQWRRLESGAAVLLASSDFRACEPWQDSNANIVTEPGYDFRRAHRIIATTAATSRTVNIREPQANVGGHCRGIDAAFAAALTDLQIPNDEE
jgi:hypothetical protein